MDGIKFIGSPKFYNPIDAFVAHLTGINGKEELMRQHNDKLLFPYFGFNWDALLDMLCDFHWIKQQKVVLVHDDLPILNEEDFRIYMEILIEAVESWYNCDAEEKHAFEVVFPR